MTTIPPRPAIFAPEHAPLGVEVKFVTFAATRPAIRPRLILVHTNGAENEGRIESAWNWSHAAPGVNTLPHYQVDRTHDGVTRARKMLATNQRGIGNATLLSAQAGHGNVSNWSIVVETADLGWPTANRPNAPGGTIGFDPGQGELIATILAYESIVHDFPLEYPQDWWGAGAACHTEPYGYPYWTIKAGKPCPGPAKKDDMRGWVLPRAREIVAAWTHPPDEEDEMPAVFWRDERYHDVFQTSPSVHYADGSDIEITSDVRVGRHHRKLRSLAIQCGIGSVSKIDWSKVPVNQIPDEPN